MRPLEPFRLSHLLTVNVSALLHKQALHYAKTHDLKLSPTVRNAILDFIHAPHSYRAPKLTPVHITRNRSINLTLLPQDRVILDQLSRDTNLTNSALIRRALYEYTKTDNPACTPAEMLMDAWGDQPKAPKAVKPAKAPKQTAGTDLNSSLGQD